MKKGISTIIASILLVVITIGLISTAYLYFVGIVSVGGVITIASAYCTSTRNITVTLRNDGTDSIDTGDITWLLNGNAETGVSCSPTSLNAAETTTCTTLNVSTNSGVNNIVAIGPRNQAGGPVTC